MTATLICAIVHTVSLTSAVFANTRTIRVLLPAGYENSSRAYPVLYLNDGFSVFRPTAIDIATLPLPPVIVVGIDNPGAADARENEYLPYPDAGFPPSHTYKPDPAHPNGKLYPRFLIDEVMPFIESRYRVLRGPSNTAIGGFSYGGVAALYAVIARPGVFGKLLLESTPLWIGERKDLLDDARKAGAWPARVSIGVGTAESPDEEINAEGQRDIHALMEIIHARSPSTGIRFVVDPGAKHNPAAWRNRLPAAIDFLFATSPRQQ